MAPAPAAAAGEDAAPRGDASRAADRGRTGAEVRDGTLSGTGGGEQTDIYGLYRSDVLLKLLD